MFETTSGCQQCLGVVAARVGVNKETEYNGIASTNLGNDRSC